MLYNVTDNRICIQNYFFEQDERGNIHVYRKEGMEYIDCIDYIGVLHFDEFKFKCKEYLSLE